MEKGESDSLNNPYDQERPKRHGQEVGNRRDDIKERPRDHHPFFCGSQQNPSDDRSEEQGRESQNSDKNTDLDFSSPQGGKIDGKRRGKDVEYGSQRE